MNPSDTELSQLSQEIKEAARKLRLGLEEHGIIPPLSETLATGFELFAAVAFVDERKAGYDLGMSLLTDIRKKVAARQRKPWEQHGDKTV